MLTGCGEVPGLAAPSALSRPVVQWSLGGVTGDGLGMQAGQHPEPGGEVGGDEGVLDGVAAPGLDADVQLMTLGVGLALGLAQGAGQVEVNGVAHRDRHRQAEHVAAHLLGC